MVFRFIIRAAFAALGLWLAERFVPGVKARDVETLVFAAVLLGVVNAFVRPIVTLITMPITCLTLGLFHFVISALMLLLVSAIPGLGFHVAGLVPAFLGAVIMGVVGLVLSWILPD